MKMELRWRWGMFCSSVSRSSVGCDILIFNGVLKPSERLGYRWLIPVLVFVRWAWWSKHTETSWEIHNLPSGFCHKDLVCIILCMWTVEERSGVCTFLNISIGYFSLFMNIWRFVLLNTIRLDERSNISKGSDRNVETLVINLFHHFQHVVYWLP